MTNIGTAGWFQTQLSGIVEYEITDLVPATAAPVVRRETSEALAMSAPVVRIGVVLALALTSLVGGLTSIVSSKSRTKREVIWNRLPALPPIPQSRQAVRGLALVSAAGLMDCFEH